MKNIISLGLFTLFFFFHVSDAHAALSLKSPTVSTEKAFQKQKTNWRQKATIWFLKRKIKKYQKKHHKIFAEDTTGCATILLKTGDKIKVKLIGTTGSEVRFFRCGEQTGEVILSKSDIQQITLSGGEMIYDSAINYANNKKKKSKRKSPNQGYGILSIITSLLSTFIVSSFPAAAIIIYLLALLSAGLSIKRHKKGKKTIGLVGIIFALIGIMLVIATAFF
ncbi:MAG TPA: hypothetical protein ENK85_08865 [Saprospiraceae bacterium]|nr:hypothetical protein [Saprospiraceae bacterium]